MDPRRRARLVLIFGVLLALIAGAGTFFMISGAQQAQPPPVLPTTDVLVATRDIPARTALVAADLRVAKVNVEVAPPLALRIPEDAIGKVTAQALSINEPILPTKLAPVGRDFTVVPPTETFSPNSPPYRVMTLTIPDNFAVGGILEVGDVVDIMYVFPFDPFAYLDIEPPDEEAAPTPTPAPGESPEPKFFPDTVAKIILGPVPILSRNAAVYTIRVDAPLAERLAYLQAAGGVMQFLLRAPGDDRAVSTGGATFETVYTTYEFPIPEKAQPLP